MISSFEFMLGYDLDKWRYYGIKEKITMDISTDTNSHMLICGASRSGKSYFEKQLFARLIKSEPDGEFYFADYKRDKSFKCLRGCVRYYCFDNTLKALDIVYNIMQKRQSGEDDTSHWVTLIWDEYAVNILSLQGDKSKEGKQRAEKVTQQVSEILMLGISLNIRIIICCQTAYQEVFNLGARLNFGVIVILGAFSRSNYDMLMKNHVEEVKDKKFGQGEGSMLLDGELYFIKVGKVEDMDKIEKLCCGALLESTEAIEFDGFNDDIDSHDEIHINN